MKFNPFAIRDAQFAAIPVLDPETKKPTGASITLAGPEHEKSKSLRFASERRVRKAMEKAGKITLDDPEVEADRTLDELVKITLGWSGFSDDEGNEMAFSPEAARKVYEGVPWLRDQMLESRRDRANFIQRSAAN